MSDINSLGAVDTSTVAAAASAKAPNDHRQDKTLPPGGKGLPPQQQQREPEPEQLEAAVTQISDYVQNISRELQFSLDDDSGQTVLKVLDSESQELVRQIPSEEMLVLARKIRQLTPEVAKGLLLQGEV